MIPKTLSMIKMEKNFRAHNDKGYHRQPYLHYDMDFWIYRLEQELEELKQARKKSDYAEMREEIGDLSNLCDYSFERTYIEEENQQPDTDDDLKALEQLFKNNKPLEKTE